MSKSSGKRPTARQRFIMEFCAKRLCVQRGYADSFDFIRSSEMYRPGCERRPSSHEVAALQDLGWIRYELWPGNYTEDTHTGKRTPHHKLVLTQEGQDAIHRRERA